MRLVKVKESLIIDADDVLDISIRNKRDEILKKYKLEEYYTPIVVNDTLKSINRVITYYVNVDDSTKLTEDEFNELVDKTKYYHIRMKSLTASEVRGYSEKYVVTLNNVCYDLSPEQFKKLNLEIN